MMTGGGNDTMDIAIANFPRGEMKNVLIHNSTTTMTTTRRRQFNSAARERKEEDGGGKGRQDK